MRYFVMNTGVPFHMPIGVTWSEKDVELYNISSKINIECLTIHNPNIIMQESFTRLVINEVYIYNTIY